MERRSAGSGDFSRDVTVKGILLFKAELSDIGPGSATATKMFSPLLLHQTAIQYGIRRRPEFKMGTKVGWKGRPTRARIDAGSARSGSDDRAI